MTTPITKAITKLEKRRAELCRELAVVDNALKALRPVADGKATSAWTPAKRREASRRAKIAWAKRKRKAKK